MNPDSTTWSEVQAFLATAHALLPPVDELPRLTVDHSSPTGLRDSILRMIRDTGEEETRALAQLHGDNTWPNISPEVNTSLAAFLSCAMALPSDPTPSAESLGCEVPGIGEAGLIRSVRWLYATWWFGDGIKEWVRSLEADRAVFDSYFIYDPI